MKFDDNEDEHDKIKTFNYKYLNNLFSSHIIPFLNFYDNSMLSFIIPSDKLDFNIDQINWVNPKSQKQWFYNCNDFVKHLSEELEHELFKDLKLMNI